MSRPFTKKKIKVLYEKMVKFEMKIKATFFFFLDWQRLRFGKSDDKGLEKHTPIHCSLG